MRFFPQTSQALLPHVLGTVFVLPAATAVMLNESFPSDVIPKFLFDLYMLLFWIGPMLGLIMSGIAWRIEKTRMTQIITLLSIIGIAEQLVIIWSLRD